jgi:hypothetical protein
MRRSLRAWLLPACLAFAACARSHVDGGVGSNQGSRPERDAGPVDAMTGSAAESPPTVSNAGSGDAPSSPNADPAVTPKITSGNGAAPPLVPERAAAEVAAALAQGPVVWIGQLRSSQPMTCKPGSDTPYAFDPDARYQPGGHFERVVIVAQGDPATGALAVRITFGEGVPPASPADLPPLTADDPFWLCYFQAPTAGFEYTGLDPFLSSERLRFAFAPNELWSSWCESREFGCDGPCETWPKCHCGDEFCEPQFPYQVELCSSSIEEHRGPRGHARRPRRCVPSRRSAPAPRDAVRGNRGAPAPPLLGRYSPAVSSSCSSVIVCIANPNWLFTSVTI